MSTVRDIITHAMRELGVLGIGKEPKAAEAEECLFRLQSIVDGLLGNGVGLELADTEINGDSDLAADSRNLVFASAPYSFTFPEGPANGARVQIVDMLGNFATYPVTIAAVPSDIILDDNGTNATYAYIADSGTWEIVSPLALSDTMPVADDEFFTLALAKRVAPIFGAQFASEDGLLRAANRIRAKFRSSAIIPCDDGVRFLSRQSWNYGLLG